MQSICSHFFLANINSLQSEQFFESKDQQKNCDMSFDEQNFVQKKLSEFVVQYHLSLITIPQMFCMRPFCWEINSSANPSNVQVILLTLKYLISRPTTLIFTSYFNEHFPLAETNKAPLLGYAYSFFSF